MWIFKCLVFKYKATLTFSLFLYKRLSYNLANTVIIWSVPCSLSASLSADSGLICCVSCTFMCGDIYRAAALMYLSPTPLHPFPFENVYSLISSFPPFAPSCFILLSHFPALPTWPEPSTVSTTFSPSPVYSSIKSWIYYVKQNRAMTLCPQSLHVIGLEWIIQPQWLKLASGRKRKLFWSCTIQAIFEWRAVSAFPAALSLSSPSPLAPSHSSHQFTHYHMKKEQILLSCLSFRRTAYKSIWWDWWLKSASFVCCVPLHLHGCGVCIFGFFLWLYL